MPLSPTAEITIDNERYFHVVEAARLAHVVRDYMSRLCRTGVVRAFRVGNGAHPGGCCRFGMGPANAPS
jgi:hypothetical protein